MQRRFRYSAVLSAVVIAVLAWSMTLSSMAGATIFTGNAAADFTGPGVIRVDDPAGDVGVPIPPIAAGTYSGWDFSAVYLDYDASTDTMYVGVDCLAICGDADGNGDPSNPGPELSKPPAEGGLGGKDPANFGVGEAFGLIIDTNNDGTFEVVVGVRSTNDLAQIGAYQYTRNAGQQLSASAWGAQLPNAVAFFNPPDGPSTSAPDLEFSIADFSTLPGFSGTVQSYKVHFGMGSIVDDGIGEDFTSLVVDVAPTPSPQPTDTPTETPTAVVPTEVPPTETPTVVPPTETPTTTPELPTETPTETPVPPTPTMVPTTGADLSALSQGKTIKPLVFSKILTKPNFARPAAPSQLQIPAIGLNTVVEELGWHAVTGADGNVFGQWDDVRFAAGWHANSALPGSTGNVVLSGHNNVYGSVFRDLSNVKVGDEITVWSGRVAHKYIVDEVSIRPETNATAAEQAINASYIRPSADQRLTLISCWPVYSNTHRVFVVAHLANDGQTSTQDQLGN